MTSGMDRFLDTKNGCVKYLVDWLVDHKKMANLIKGVQSALSSMSNMGFLYPWIEYAYVFHKLFNNVNKWASWQTRECGVSPNI